MYAKRFKIELSGNEGLNVFSFYSFEVNFCMKLLSAILSLSLYITYLKR